MSSAGGKILALFDVDETLIATKSMFDFLLYFGEGSCAIDAPGVIASISRMKAAGADRASVNLAFWKAFAGLPRQEVRRSAGRWASERLAGGAGFVIAPVQERLLRHRELGHHVALVSGSSLDILEPLARALRADTLLATRQLSSKGRYTGEILLPPMIGPGKREAAARLATRLGADLARSYAYGDHLSDLPMLELVGQPAMVGADARLAAVASRRGWPRLADPGTARPGGTVP